MGCFISCLFKPSTEVQDQLTHSTLIPSESPVRSYGSYEPTEYMRNLFSEESTLSFSAPVESQVEQSDSIHISPEDEPVVISDTVSTRSPEHARVIESSITTSEVLIVASDLEATQEVMPSPLVDNSSTSITIESTTSQEYGSIETFRREEPMPYHFEFTQQSLPPFFAVNQIPDEHPATSTQLNIDSLPEEPFLANEDVITVTTSFRTEEEHSPVMDQPLESLPVAAPFKPSELEERFKSIAKGLGDETNVHLHLQRQAILQLKKVIPLVRTEQEEKMLLDVLPKLYRWMVQLECESVLEIFYMIACKHPKLFKTKVQKKFFDLLRRCSGLPIICVSPPCKRYIEIFTRMGYSL